MCPTMSDAAVDSSSEMSTNDMKEKKVVEEEVESGRDASTNGNTNKENGEKEADSVVNDEEERDDSEGRRLRQSRANEPLKMMKLMMLTPKKQKIDEDD